MAVKRRKNSGRRAGSFRTCAGCRERIPRRSSLRLVCSDNGRLLPDLFGKLPGRGVHLCPQIDCFHKATERGAFSRTLRTSVEDCDPLQLCQKFLDASLDQIRFLLSSSIRSGWLRAGRTSVHDSLKKKTIALVLVAENSSTSLQTEMLRAAERVGVSAFSVLMTQDYSRLHSGKLVSVMGVMHRGLAQRLAQEITRASSLRLSLAEWTKQPRSKLTARSDRGKMPQQRSGSGFGRA